MAVDLSEPTIPMIAGGAVALAVLFVTRELASGVLRQAGGDLWDWIKRSTTKKE